MLCIYLCSHLGLCLNVMRKPGHKGQEKHSQPAAEYERPTNVENEFGVALAHARDNPKNGNSKPDEKAERTDDQSDRPNFCQDPPGTFREDFSPPG